MLKRIGVMLLLALMIIVFAASVAHASVRPLTGGQHGCTNTNPEYTVSNWNTRLSYSPGRVQFTAQHRPEVIWEDAYLVTGFNRGSSAQSLCGHFGSSYAYQLPVKADAPLKITGGMRYRISDFHGRPGWDVWLTARGAEYTETTARAMEHDPRTVEVMIEPGFGHRIWSYSSNRHWHVVFVEGGNLSNVNILASVNAAFRSIGISPSKYYYSAIDGGAEFSQGRFEMLSYRLNVSTYATETRSATATASYTARSGALAVTATRRVTLPVTRTVTLPVQGASLGAVRAVAASSAASAALASAEARVPAAAFSAAHAAATEALAAKLHPYRKLPNVVHHRLGWAIATLRHAGFRNLRWTRGLKPSAVVHWEAGHPGHLTNVKARIILHARRH